MNLIYQIIFLVFLISSFSYQVVNSQSYQWVIEKEYANNGCTGPINRVSSYLSNQCYYFTTVTSNSYSHKYTVNGNTIVRTNFNGTACGTTGTYSNTVQINSCQGSVFYSTNQGPAITPVGWYVLERSINDATLCVYENSRHIIRPSVCVTNSDVYQTPTYMYFSQGSEERVYGEVYQETCATNQLWFLKCSYGMDTNLTKLRFTGTSQGQIQWTVEQPSFIAYNKIYIAGFSITLKSSYYFYIDYFNPNENIWNTVCYGFSNNGCEITIPNNIIQTIVRIRVSGDESIQNTYTWLSNTLTVPKIIDIPSNPAKFIYNSYKVYYYNYSYKDAVNLAETAIPNKKGYLLTLESKDELNYIKTYLTEMNENVSFWLGAQPMDTSMSSWKWVNGTMRDQVFHQVYPERCYGYCGRFIGNYDSNKQALAFSGTDVENWFGSKRNDMRYVIVEYGYSNAEAPIFNYLDFREQVFYISQFVNYTSKPFSMTFLYRNQGLTCADRSIEYVSQTERKIKCTLPQINDFSGPIKVTINVPSGSTDYVYYYNSPFIQYVKQVSPKQLLMYGLNFGGFKSTSLYLGNSSTYTPSIYPTEQFNRITFVSSFEFTFALPILLNDTSITTYIKNPPVAYNGLVYQYYPIPVKFSDTLGLKGQLLNSPGELAYLNTASLIDFASNQLQIKNDIWTNLLWLSPNFKYNAFVVGGSNSPIDTSNGADVFYFNYTTSIYCGLTAMVSPNLRMPFLTAYGVNVVGYNESLPINNVPLSGGKLIVPVKGNTGTPNSKAKMTFSNNMNVYNGVSNFERTQLEFTLPPGTGTNMPAKITLSMDDVYNTFTGSFFISYSYVTPKITQINIDQTIPGNLTIIGNSFGFSTVNVSVNFPCSIKSINDSVILCEYLTYTLTQPIIDVAVNISGQVSNYVTVRPLFITNVSPKKFTLQGGTVTIDGFGLFIPSLKDPIISIKDTALGCVINSKNYNQIQCDLPTYTQTQIFTIKFNRSGTVIEYPGLLYQKLNITNYEQNEKNITVVGENLYLFNNSDLKIFLGDGSPSNIKFSNDTSLSFIVNSNCNNGLFNFEYKNDLFSTNVTWNPVILSVTPNILDPAVETNVKTLLMNPYEKVIIGINTHDTVDIQLNGVNDFKFYPPTYSGKDLNFQLTHSTNDKLLRSNIVKVSYKPPVITSTYANITIKNNVVSCNVTAIGNYLGIMGSVYYTTGLYGNINDSFTPSSQSYSKLEFPCTPNIRSGFYVINVDGQLSNLEYLDIIPRIREVSELKVLGSLLTITGYFLAPYSFDGASKLLDIYIGDKLCQDLKIVGNSYDPYTLTCLSPAGAGNSTFVVSYPKGKLTSSISYQTPKISNVVSTYYNEKGQVTVYGSGFYNKNLVVTIGQVECTNATITKGDSEMICDFSSEEGNSTSTLPVTVSVADISFTSYSFMYLVKPNPCPVCENGGSCDTKLGKCICTSGFAGNLCNIRINNQTFVDPPRLAENTSVTVELGSTKQDIKFNINITEIREVDPSNNIVKQYFIKDIKWFNVSKLNDLTFIYSGEFSNDDQLQIDVSMQIFINQSQYNFQGDLFTVPSNSVKYQVQIKRWTFKEKTNILQVLFLTQMPEQSSNGCLRSELTGTVENSDSSLRAMEIQQGIGILSAYFSDRMVIDGRVTKSAVTLLDENDESMKALKMNGIFNVLTAVNINHFENTAVIDPNFGSLLTTADKNQCASDNDKKWKLPVIITFSIVGGLACAITIVKAVSTINVNPTTGHVYEIYSLPFTFNAAFLNATRSTYNNLNGHILQIDDYEESKYLSTILNNLGVPNYWLNARSLDDLQNQWGWINGTTRGNPFYRSAPERSFKYSGDFTGNVDRNLPHLLLEGYQSQQHWRGASDTEQAFLIIEYEPSDTVKIDQEEPGSLDFNFKFPSAPVNPKFYVKSMPCLVSSSNQQNNSYSCSVTGQIASNIFKFDIVIENNGINTTYNYSYNYPRIQAVVPTPVASMVTVIGNTFQYFQSPGFKYFINGTEYGGSVLAYSTIHSLTFMISQVLTKFYLPISITSENMGIKYTINRPVISDPTTSLFYAYQPGNFTYEEASALASYYKMFTEYGYLALINNTQTLDFVVNNAIGNNNFKAWTEITVKNGVYSYNERSIYTSIAITTASGNRPYYLDGVNMIYNQASDVDMKASIIFALGIRAPVVDSTFPQVPLSNSGGPLNIVMLSNYGYRDTQLSAVINNQTFPASLNYSKALISFVAPPGNGRVPATIYIQKFGYSTSFKYDVIYKGATITNINASALSETITITGTSFVGNITTSPFNCTSTGYISETYYICKYPPDLQNGKKYSFSIESDISGKSNSMDVTINYFVLYAVYPTAISRNGGNITMTGTGFRGEPDTPVIKLSSGVMCNSPILVNNNYYVCTMGPSYNNGSQSISIQIDNYFAKGNVNLTVQDFFIDNIVQNGENVLVTGKYFSLYTISVTVGTITPQSLVCSDNNCTFTLTSLNTNGEFTIGSPYLSYTNYQKVWTPVLKPTYNAINPYSSCTIYGLYFGDKTYSVLVNGNRVVPDAVYLGTIEFLPPYLIGNVTIQVSGLLDSNVITAKYPDPYISSVDRNGAIVGDFFGNVRDIIVIYGISKTPILKNTSNYTSILFDVPLDAKTGFISVTVNTIPSDKMFFPIEPIPLSFSKLNVMGGKLTITGRFMSLYSIDSVSILNISIEGSSALPTQIGDSFDPYVYVIDSPPGVGSLGINFNHSTGSFTKQLLYPPPYIKSCSPTKYLTAGIVTIFGENFGNFNLSVSIGNQTCQNPQVNALGTEITCLYSSNISSKDSLSVNVNVGALSDQKYAFMYTIPVECANCINGVCNLAGTCQCNTGWTGMNCTSKIIQDVIASPNVIGNTTTVQLSSTIKDITFNVNITEIRELDPNLNVVKQYYLRDIKWFKVEKVDESYTYSGSFDNDTKLQIDVTMHVFTNTTEYNFVGDIFTIPANSIKYEVSVSNWTFSQNTNSLQVLFLSQAKAKVEQECQTYNSKIEGKSESSTSLRMMEINQAGGILQSYFSDRMVVDGRIRYSEVSMVDSKDKAMEKVNLEYPGNLNVLFAINIPQFENSAIVDPNFGSLLVEDQNKDKCSESDNKWKLPVIVTCSVVGGIALAIGITFLIKKKFRYQLKLASVKLKSLR